MFTRNRTLAARMLVAAACLMVVSALGAMAADNVVVKVPFDFKAGKTPLPAGEYTFAIDNASPGIVRINSADGHTRAILLTQRLPKMYDSNRPSVSFNVYGETRVLSRVMGSGGWQAPQPAAERRIARTTGQSEVESVIVSSEAPGSAQAMSR